MPKEEKQTSVYVTAFITVLLAIAFISAIANLTQTSTAKTSVANEVIDGTSAKVGPHFNESVNLGPVVNYPTGWKIEDCPLANIVVTNASGTELTVTTDYTLSTTTGILNLKNTTATQAGFKADNNTLIDYTYCGTGYVNSNWGRTILNTNVGLYAIAILIIGVALVYLLLNRKD